MNMSLSQPSKPSKRIARIIGIIVVALSIIIHVTIFYGLSQITFNFASLSRSGSRGKHRPTKPIERVVLFKAESQAESSPEIPAALIPSKTPFGNTPFDVEKKTDEIPTELAPLDDIHGIPQSNLTLPTVKSEKTTSCATAGEADAARETTHTSIGQIIEDATIGEKSAIKTEADPQALVAVNLLPTGKLENESTDQLGGNRPKPKRNIFALTKGFIENLHTRENGPDSLARDGDRTKRPSFDELKYISYNERILWQAQSAWKRAHRVVLPRNNLSVTIACTVDAKGHLVNAKILESTGYKFVDDRVVEAFTQGSPYPPIPKHFNSAQYRLTLALSVCNEKWVQ